MANTILQGIDVSTFQGAVDFPALANSKSFVFIKSSEGCPPPGDNSNYTDNQFVRSKQEVRACGMPHGYYHFGRPDYNPPADEAKTFLAIVQPEKNELLALDLEVSWNGDYVAWAKIFLDTIQQETGGYKAGIYINYAMSKEHDWTPVINAGYWLWLAEWNFSTSGSYSTDQPWPFASFQQYSDNEKVNGMTVDGDLFFGDINQLLALGYQPVSVASPVDPKDQTIAQQSAQIAQMQAEADVSQKNIIGLRANILDLQIQLTQAKDISDEEHTTIVTLTEAVATSKAQLNAVVSQSMQQQNQSSTVVKTTTYNVPAPPKKQGPFSSFLSYFFTRK